MAGILNKAELEVLFRELYQPLCKHSLYFVRRMEIAEEIVQDVFVELWEKREHLLINKSHKAYLFAAVKNKSIDYLRSKIAQQNFETVEKLAGFQEESDPRKQLEEKELNAMVTDVMKSLPEKCYLIFSMSRFGNYSNKEIAEELNISIWTVETQISNAIKRLKQKIDKFITLIIF